MKKLQKLLKFLSTETTQDDLRLNTLMSCVFDEKTTIESIDLFERFKTSYEAELKKRNLNALIENSDIEAYFNRTKEIKVINPVIVN